MMILLWLGIAINIVGAIILGAYAIKYYFAFKEARQMPVKFEEVKAQWLAKRKIAFAMIFVGLILTYIAAVAG